MGRVNFERLVRQLNYKTHGLIRRRQLLESARNRTAREQERASMRGDATLREALLSDLVEIARLEEVYGAHRGRGKERDDGVILHADRPVDEAATAVKFAAVGDAPGNDVVVLDASFPFVRSKDGICWDRPVISSPDRPATLEPGRIAADDVKGDFLERIASIPGYGHMCYLVQTQWLDNDVFERAVDIAERRGVIGAIGAPDLRGVIVDGSACGEGKNAERYWKKRDDRIAGADIGGSAGENEG